MDTALSYPIAAREQYPAYNLHSRLIEYTAELLARNHFETKGHPGTPWDEWLAGGPHGSREETLAPYQAHAQKLAEMDMLSWPKETRFPDTSWHVQGASNIRLSDGTSGLDWIEPFGFNAEGAIEYAAACITTGIPHRLSWSFNDAFGQDHD